MKRKILLLIDSLGGGGAENVLITLLKHLDRLKYDITLTTIVDAGVHNKQIPDWINYKAILRLPDSIFSNIVYHVKYKLIHKILPLNWVYRLYVPKNNDVEIAFVEGFSTKLLSYSTNKKSKKIAWVHIDLINNHWISSVYNNPLTEKRSYSVFNSVIGVSKQVTEAVRALYNVRNAITLYNPIDSNEIILKSKETIDTLIDRKKYRLVTIGRLEQQKGYDRLLRIIKQLVYHDRISLELWVLGNGSLYEELKTYTSMNGLDALVTFWGFKSNPYPYLAQSDVFVCSSRSEGYSTAVTEAIILGLPIVTTDCSGMKELLGENNEYGIVTENNEEALYFGLKGFLIDEEKQKHYKRMVDKRSKEFSIEKLMDSIESVFEL